MPNKHPIRVLIADDHEIYLDGLKKHLSGNETYEVVGEAMNGEELIRKAKSLQPHIILTDLKMPLVSGVDAIRTLFADAPDIRCIVLTNYDNELSIIEALEAGAKGYISKNMPKKDLFTALDEVSRGYPYFCQATSARMVRLIGRSHFNPYTDLKRVSFSATELKIVQLVCEEKDNQEIAATLSLSVRTVENNRSRILKKMNVRTTAGIAIYAIKYGLFHLKD